MRRTLPRHRAWLSRTLVVLTLVSLTQDAASELLYPLLPILLTSILGAAPFALGLIEGLAEAAAGFTKLISGRKSDQFGRKPFVVLGYSMAGIGKALVVLAQVWPIVLIGRVVDRIGKGMRSAPRDALITDSVAKKDLGKAFGFHRAGDNLGAVIGPFIALFGLSIWHDDIRKVATFAIIPALLSAFLTFAVREVRPIPKAIQVQEAALDADAQVMLSSKLKRIIAILVFIQLTNIPDVLILLRLHDLGYTTSQVVLLYILYNTVNTFAAFPAGHLVDKIHPRISYSIGLCACASAYLVLAFTQKSWLVLLAVGLYGLFPSFTDGVGKAWIGRLSTENNRGKAQGTFQAAMNFAVLGAGLWGGAIWSRSRVELPLLIAGAGALAGAVLVFGTYSSMISETD